MSISASSRVHPLPLSSVFHCRPSDEEFRSLQASRAPASASQGWLESATTFSPSLIATPEDIALISANLRRYINASAQYSPVASTHTVPEGASTAALAIEREALAGTDGAIREDMQSLRVVTPQISSPSQDVPRSSSLVPQPPTDARRPSQQRIPSDPSLTRPQSSSPKSLRPTNVAVKILPAKYEFCDVEDLVVIIAGMISELTQINDQLPLKDGGLTRFHSKTAPRILVADYLQRLTTHATLTPPLLLTMVYYMDLLCSLYPAFTITSLTIHRFLIAAAIVAAKGLSDSYYRNATYARVGGVKVGELSVLEMEFLCRVDWKIVPHPEVLVDYYRSLVGRADRYVLEDDALPTEEGILLIPPRERASPLELF